MVDDAVLYFMPNRHQYKIFSAMLVVFIVTCLCALHGFQAEAVLNVRLEGADIPILDPEYYDLDQSEAFIVEDIDNDETTITTKLIIIKKFTEDLQAELAIKGLSMGEYTLDTGIFMRAGLCDIMSEPIFAVPFADALGFTQDNCPPGPQRSVDISCAAILLFQSIAKSEHTTLTPPVSYSVNLPTLVGKQIYSRILLTDPFLRGNYTTEGYKVSQELFPDDFPENKYLIYFELRIPRKRVLRLEFYADIQTEY